jgi:chromosome segregation ATPase
VIKSHIRWSSNKENIMDIKALERNELAELVVELGNGLGDRIVNEQALKLRIKGLERLVDNRDRAARIAAGERLLALEVAKDDLETRIEELETAADEALEELKNAKVQMEEYTARTGDDIAALNNAKARLEEANGSLASAGKKHLAEAEALKVEVRRLEKELREARAAVMNEVSAMIPKAVEAEREACANVARQAALACADLGSASSLIAVVNAINARRK